MITEDYVSFEVAKLLKEKGFDSPTGYYFNKDGIVFSSGIVHINNDNPLQTTISRPTIQMAMKWLRKVHNICISADVKVGGGKYYVCISNTENGRSYVVLENKVWDTFEEACEESIKYCLENLI